MRRDRTSQLLSRCATAVSRGSTPAGSVAGIFEAEVGGTASDRGIPPITLAHNMPDVGGVDSVMADAAAAGGEIVVPAAHRSWGGYSGYFADPDGFRWEVAYNPGPLGVELMRDAGLA